MVIHTADKEYQVIHRKRETEAFELLICQNLRSTADTTYTLIRFFEQAMIRKILEKNVLEQELTGNFVDYVESFLWEESLVMVFVRRKGTSLHTWLLQSDVSLLRRLEVGKRLLERLLLLNMPEYLLCSVLNGDCILVTDSMEVVLNYEPKELSLSGHETELLPKGFYQVFSLLFRKEEQEQVCPELQVFLEQLKQEPYQDVFRLYQTYDQMQERLMGTGDMNQLKPNTWMYRMQKLGIRLLNLGKKLAVPGIVIAGMILLVYLICHPAKEVTEEQRIEQIGTLYIR